jgi:hypothetical protein
VVEAPVLSDDARLLHIGFRKCGTSALQSSLRKARHRLPDLGVVYPGSYLNHTTAALAVTRRRNGPAARGAKRRPLRDWRELVDQVATVDTHHKAVVSSEFFDISDESTIRAILKEFGDDRVHVVATVRPIDKVLPSTWQQSVQFGTSLSYEQWLGRVLDDEEPSGASRVFWERHSHADVLERWARVLGPERVTLVVLDERDRHLPFRALEAMLDLPVGTLNEVPGHTNRSLTMAEAEFLRRANETIMARDITWEEYTYWIRRGAAHEMWLKRSPQPDELRITTPRWALDRASEITATTPQRIHDLGIHVVGNLASLASAGPGAEASDADLMPSEIPIEAAVHALAGACLSSRGIPRNEPAVAPAPPQELTGRQLLGLARKYLRRRVRRRSSYRAS